KWFNKVGAVSNNKVEEFIKDSLGLEDKYNFYYAYFYLIMKSESYLFEFADLAFTDIKNFIKEHYTECLNSNSFKGLAGIFKVRKEILPIEFLQEYSGKNRSRETLKKEDSFITKKDIYYLNPLIDDLWRQHGYDKLEFGSL